MYAHPHVYTRTQVRAARCPPAPVAASSRRPRPRDVCAPRLSPVIGLAAGGATRTARGGLVLGSVGWREGGHRLRTSTVAGLLVACRRGDIVDDTPSRGRPPAADTVDDDDETTEIVTLSREFTRRARCCNRPQQTLSIYQFFFKIFFFLVRGLRCYDE